MPKPARTRKPRQKCPFCGNLFTARALLRHADGCGRKNRYGSVAQKTQVCGETFPSRFESRVWLLLKSFAASGIYTSVKRYPSVELLPGIRWKVDFLAVCAGTGTEEYVEAKGAEDATYLRNLKLWRLFRPARLTIYKDDGRGNPRIHEELHPCGRRIEWRWVEDER